MQTYLLSDNNEERRIRQRGKNGNFTYTLTTKQHVSNIKRIEKEKRITKDEYITLLNDCDTSLHQVRKTRYLLMQNNIYFEIDIYPNCKNTAILEIELSDETSSDIAVPEFIKIIKEVTDDKTFSNKSLASNFPSELN